MMMFFQSITFIFQKKILFFKNIVFIFLFKYIAQVFVVFKSLYFPFKFLCDFCELLASTSSKYQATRKVSCVLSAFMVFLLISWLSFCFCLGDDCGDGSARNGGLAVVVFMVFFLWLFFLFISLFVIFLFITLLHFCKSKKWFFLSFKESR